MTTTDQPNQIHNVLLIPAEGDPLGLLAEGPCGARPPAARHKRGHADWLPGWHPKGIPGHEPQWSTRFALVLAWDGQPVAEGLDRFWRCWNGSGYYAFKELGPTPEVWLVHIAVDAEVSCSGTVVLVDAQGQEVQP